MKRARGGRGSLPGTSRVPFVLVAARRKACQSKNHTAAMEIWRVRCPIPFDSLDPPSRPRPHAGPRRQRVVARSFREGRSPAERDSAGVITRNKPARAESPPRPPTRGRFQDIASVRPLLAAIPSPGGLSSPDSSNAPSSNAYWASDIFVWPLTKSLIVASAKPVRRARSAAVRP